MFGLALAAPAQPLLPSSAQAAGSAPADAHVRDIGPLLMSRIAQRPDPTAPFTIHSWGDSTVKNVARQLWGGLRAIGSDVRTTLMRASEPPNDARPGTLFPPLDLPASATGMCSQLEIESTSGKVRLEKGMSADVNIIGHHCTNATLDFRLAGEAMTDQLLSAPPYSLPPQADLVLVGPAALHLLHREDLRPFAWTKTFCNSSDAYGEVLRTGLRLLEGAYPTADLRLMNTHAICNEKLDSPTVKRRALACDIGATDECFACHAEELLCEDVKPEERELFYDSVFSSKSTDRLAKQELAVLSEPEFKERWTLVRAHAMTKAAGCNLTADGVHYVSSVEADEAMAALSMDTDLSASLVRRPGLRAVKLQNYQNMLAARRARRV